MDEPGRVPNAVHLSQPWRIHEVVADFRLEDVWQLPGTGDAEDWPRLVDLVAGLDPATGTSQVARLLWALRWRLGAVLGWDGDEAGIGGRVPSLRDRLPEDLLAGPRGPEFVALPFASLYLTDTEWAAEVANQTMHGLMHVGRIPDGAGRFRAQMAVYVKPNGLLGHAYMAAIRPFRHLVVYPPMLRDGARAWEAARSAAAAVTAGAGHV